MQHFTIPTLVSLTAPSCAGKNFLLEAMIERLGFERIVGTTDRAPRDGEIEGVHYNFLTREQSQQYEAEGKFAEFVVYNGTRYGVTHEEMDRKLRSGGPAPIVILEPNGVDLYRKYCGSRKYAMFTVYVETNEDIRLDRLAVRTRADLLLAIKRNEGNLKSLATSVDTIVRANNKRLKAIIEQERLWSHQHRWDAIISGTDLNKALADLQQAVANRNKRTEIYA